MTHKHYTTEPDSIDVPEWARKYDVGDTLRCTFEGSEYNFTMIGWSTFESNEGKPVIATVEMESKTGMDRPTNGHTVAVNKERIFTQ